ncbi:hypothetical protein BN137_1205 [Cronobacter condimenti 1330]|uniref:Uncharacterized protein n=1 Tax=Cronobacter condimenti 1330 TaxID=1073999 RepID=K8A7Z3_9ENTR|nr:hypothetical protein BN137_1205 [Cronobacter condimenti 1330]
MRQFIHLTAESRNIYRYWIISGRGRLLVLLYLPEKSLAG